MLRILPLFKRILFAVYYAQTYLNVFQQTRGAKIKKKSTYLYQAIKIALVDS